MSNSNTKVEQYVRLRDHKAAAKKEFDEGMKRVTDAMTKLEAELLDDIRTAGVTSLNGEGGTAYVVVRSSATVKDRDEFFKFAIQNKILEALDIKANKKVIKDLLEKGVEVPGVKYTEANTIGIRRGKGT